MEDYNILKSKFNEDLNFKIFFLRLRLKPKLSDYQKNLSDNISKILKLIKK